MSSGSPLRAPKFKFLNSYIFFRRLLSKIGYSFINGVKYRQDSGYPFPGISQLYQRIFLENKESILFFRHHRFENQFQQLLALIQGDCFRFQSNIRSMIKRFTAHPKLYFQHRIFRNK